MTPDDFTVQYMDYPPPGLPRGWYITAPEHEHIEEGPFPTLRDAEAAFAKYFEEGDE